MANSLSAEVWLDERRWDALEKALKARGTDIEQHLQDYLMKLYSETVPFDQWVQIEGTITKEELEKKSMQCFMSGSMDKTGCLPRRAARNSSMWPSGSGAMYGAEIPRCAEVLWAAFIKRSPSPGNGLMS